MILADKIMSLMIQQMTRLHLQFRPLVLTPFRTMSQLIYPICSAAVLTHHLILREVWWMQPIM